MPALKCEVFPINKKSVSDKPGFIPSEVWVVRVGEWIVCACANKPMANSVAQWIEQQDDLEKYHQKLDLNFEVWNAKKRVLLAICAFEDIAQYIEELYELSLAPDPDPDTPSYP
jgi:hypothetical protein